MPIFHLGSPRKRDPTKCQVSFAKFRKKLFPVAIPGHTGGERLQIAISCGLAVSMREAAKHILFEGFQAGCHVVLRGRRSTS